MAFHVPHQFRIRQGVLGSSDEIGNAGAFLVPVSKLGKPLTVVASDGGGWEHVSVSRKDRTPSWEELCKIKDLFWDAEDWVIQFHPAHSEYVNNHRYTLHLWRPTDQEFPTPPSWMVGIKSLGELAGPAPGARGE